MSRYRKLVVFIVGIGIAWLVDNGVVVPFDEQEGAAMVISILTGWGVWKAPNDPA